MKDPRLPPVQVIVDHSVPDLEIRCSPATFRIIQKAAELGDDFFGIYSSRDPHPDPPTLEAE